MTIVFKELVVGFPTSYILIIANMVSELRLSRKIFQLYYGWYPLISYHIDILGFTLVNHRVR